MKQRYARKLTAKQVSMVKQGMETAYGPVYSSDDLQNLEAIVAVNDYETVYQDIDRLIGDLNSEKMMGSRWRQRFAKKMSYSVIYVSANESYTATLDESNCDDVAALEEVVAGYFLATAESDDFWIDDIFSNGDAPQLSKEVFTAGGSRLDQEMVDMVFGDAEFPVKAEFLVNEGLDITAENLEEVYVQESSSSNLVWSDGDDLKFPEDWLDQMFEEYFPDLYKALDDANAQGYFNPANLFRDMNWNGDIRVGFVDDYFCWSYLR